MHIELSKPNNLCDEYNSTFVTNKKGIKILCYDNMKLDKKVWKLCHCEDFESPS